MCCLQQSCKFEQMLRTSSSHSVHEQHPMSVGLGDKASRISYVNDQHCAHLTCQQQLLPLPDLGHVHRFMDGGTLQKLVLNQVFPLLEYEG